MEKVYAVSYRDGVMLKLTEDYKYKSIRKTAEVLAELMSAAIPKRLKDVVVVPLPTIAKHIRERGFDHTLLLAKSLARLRGWKVEQVIGRVNKTVQVGADEETRRRQAKEAYEVASVVDAETTYLLIDDVWTTGASMEAATKAIKKAGAKKVAAAVVLIPED
ncbi:ComF family protein [Candidatus Saccharibacteria bacterium]|nr:ComF family protein [Candidatus Saccharibacteria bacterium]